MQVNESREFTLYIDLNTGYKILPKYLIQQISIEIIVASIE